MRKKSQISVSENFRYEIGDVFSYRKQIYNLVRKSDYICKNGNVSIICYFESVCPECHTNFETSMIMPFNKQSPNRRCKECANPLVRVKLTKEYKENYC